MILLSVLSTSILLSACSPRDNKVTKPGSPTVNAAGLPAVDPKFENYKYVAVLVERQIEVLEIFKALSNETFSVSRGITLAPGKIVTNANNQSGVTRVISLDSEVTKDEAGNVTKIVLTQNNAETSFENAVSGERKIELKNESKNISIIKNSAGNFDVVYKSVNNLNSVSTGQAYMIETLKFNFSVVDAGFENFKIHATELSHVRIGSAVNANTAMKSSGDLDLNIEMKNAEKCSSITGAFKLDAIETKTAKDGKIAPLYSNVFTYTATEVKIVAGKALSLPMLPCDVRPTVDLSKLF